MAMKALNEFYRKVATTVRGTVVKYMGDRALLCFEREHANPGMVAMLNCSRSLTVDGQPYCSASSAIPGITCSPSRIVSRTTPVNPGKARPHSRGL